MLLVSPGSLPRRLASCLLLPTILAHGSSPRPPVEVQAGIPVSVAIRALSSWPSRDPGTGWHRTRICRRRRTVVRLVLVIIPGCIFILPAALRSAQDTGTAHGYGCNAGRGARAETDPAAHHVAGGPFFLRYEYHCRPNHAHSNALILVVWYGVGACHGVLLQKCSTKNGIIRPALLHAHLLQSHRDMRYRHAISPGFYGHCQDLDMSSSNSHNSAYLSVVEPL